MRALLCTALLLAGVGCTRETTCELDGKRYPEGAMLFMNGSLYACQGQTTWTTVKVEVLLEQ